MTSSSQNHKQETKNNAGREKIKAKTSSMEVSKSFYDLIEEQDLDYQIKQNDMQMIPKTQTKPIKI